MKYKIPHHLLNSRGKFHRIFILDKIKIINKNSCKSCPWIKSKFFTSNKDCDCITNLKIPNLAKQHQKVRRKIKQSLKGSKKWR
jgi:hypothetical protein